MKATPLHNLLCFDWLAVERWTANMLLSDPDLRTNECYCKVCDALVAEKDAEKHATFHRNEFKTYKKKAAAEAKRAREEGKKRAAAERRALKEAEKDG